MDIKYGEVDSARCCQILGIDDEIYPFVLHIAMIYELDAQHSVHISTSPLSIAKQNLTILPNFKFIETGMEDHRLMSA